MKIISMKEAKSQDLKRYFTGKPCRNGHISERITTNRACLECHSLRSKENYNKNTEYYKKYSLDNRDKIRSYWNDYSIKNKERIKQKSAAYSILASKRLSEYNARHYSENRKYYLEKGKQYYEDNKDKYTTYSRNRRARIKNTDGYHTDLDIIAMLERQKHKCANCLCCLKESGYHVDHIMPLARGGSNWPSNLQCLCPTCNLRKNAKDPIQWAQENGRLL